jgi:hypothetical protein
MLSLASSLKTARGGFLLFKSYWFLNMVTSEIFLIFWKYLGQVCLWKQNEITHFKGILIRKPNQIRKNYNNNFWGYFLRFFFNSGSATNSFEMVYSKNVVLMQIFLVFVCQQECKKKNKDRRRLTCFKIN